MQSGSSDNQQDLAFARARRISCVYAMTLSTIVVVGATAWLVASSYAIGWDESATVLGGLFVFSIPFGVFLGFMMAFGQRRVAEYIVVRMLQYWTCLVLLSVATVVVSGVVAFFGVLPLGASVGHSAATFPATLMTSGLIAIGFGAIGATALFRLGIVVRADGADVRCRSCGYDLRGAESQRCPECGSTESGAS